MGRHRPQSQRHGRPYPRLNRTTLPTTESTHRHTAILVGQPRRLPCRGAPGVLRAWRPTRSDAPPRLDDRNRPSPGRMVGGVDGIDHPGTRVRVVRTNSPGPRVLRRMTCRRSGRLVAGDPYETQFEGASAATSKVGTSEFERCSGTRLRRASSDMTDPSERFSALAIARAAASTLPLIPRVVRILSVQRITTSTHQRYPITRIAGACR